MQFTILAFSTLLAMVAASPASPVVRADEDKPTLFAASFYDNGDGGCGGAETSRYRNGEGNCVDKFVRGSGAALVRINRDLSNQPSFTLTGWSETGCQGDKVVVQKQVDVCTPLNGVDVKSWSDI